LAKDLLFTNDDLTVLAALSEATRRLTPEYEEPGGKPLAFAVPRVEEWQPFTFAGQ
jgi:hypothetical protein